MLPKTVSAKYASSTLGNCRGRALRVRIIENVPGLLEASLPLGHLGLARNFISKLCWGQHQIKKKSSFKTSALTITNIRKPIRYRVTRPDYDIEKDWDSMTHIFVH